MGEAVGRTEGQGFFSRFFAAKEPKSDLSELVHEQAAAPKMESPSLLGRVVKGSYSVAKTLTSTQLLVAITLLSVTALVLVLTFPVIKPFLVGLPLFVALAGFTASKGIAVFLITKALALLGLSLSGAGFGLKGLMALLSHFTGSDKSTGSAPAMPQKPQKKAKPEAPSEPTLEKTKSADWAEEFTKQKDLPEATTSSSDASKLEQAWQAATGAQETGGVTPSPVAAVEEPAEWSEEYLSSDEEMQPLVGVDPRMEKAWVESTKRGGRILSTSEERLIAILQHLDPLKASL